MSIPSPPARVTRVPMASTAARPWATKTAPMPSNPPAKKRVVDTAGYRGVPVASKAARVRARPSDPEVARAQLQDGLVIGQGAGEVALTLAAAPATGEGVGIPRVDSASGKSDLSLVGGQMIGSSGKNQIFAVRPLLNRYKHRSGLVPVLGNRSGSSRIQRFGDSFRKHGRCVLCI